MVLAIFKLRYQPHVDHSAEAALAGPLYELVSNLPGFVSMKDFQAADGEMLNIIEFTSLEALDQWRNHPQHLQAKQRHAEFYSSYQIQICEVQQTYGSP